jgi:formylglycine-generating enzyme required for sulfatase activity
LIVAGAFVACGELQGATSTTADAGDAEASEAGATAAGAVTCPKRAGPVMVPVTAGGTTFCIDSTEVTRRDYMPFALSNQGKGFQPPSCASNGNFEPNCGTPTANDDDPINCVDWCDAYAYCKSVGKRLCGRIGGGSLSLVDVTTVASDEWGTACSGAGARLYAYGDTAQPGTCISDVTDGGGPSPLGASARCKGGFDGLFDMSGNVAEWQDVCDDDAGTCLARGGSFKNAANEQLCARIETKSRNSRGPEYGVRCCADPQ